MKIIGAKGKISDVDKFLKTVNNYNKKHNLVNQLFDAELIYGKNHIVSAVEHAKRSMDRKTNTTNSLEMEILLYASGERQLKIAIPKMGIKKNNTKIAIVFINDISDKLIDELLNECSLVKDNKVLEGNIDTLKKFGLNEDEIKTVQEHKYEDLILEKVAMVDIIK